MIFSVPRFARGRSTSCRASDNGVGPFKTHIALQSHVIVLLSICSKRGSYVTKHCITCLPCICMSIYFCTGCCRDICSRRAMLLWHRNNVSWIVVHCFWHEQPMKPYFHQPPLQLLGRKDQQMLALGLRLWILRRPARVKKTRWNAHGNANEYVPTAH